MSSKKEKALALIRAEVATTGEITKKAVLAYVENRISGKEWHQAIDLGFLLFKSKK